MAGVSNLGGDAPEVFGHLPNFLEEPTQTLVSEEEIVRIIKKVEDDAKKSESNATGVIMMLRNEFRKIGVNFP